MLLFACNSKFPLKYKQTKDFCKAILSASSTICQVLTRRKLSGVKLGCTDAQRLITGPASDDNTSWTNSSNKQYKMATGRNSPRVNGMERAPKPFIIGVAGGTASGKSSVCAKIMEELGQSSMECHHRQVAIISQDAFYRNLTEPEKLLAQKGEFNFDHPDAFDSDLMISTVKDIRAGRRVLIPTYSYINNAREDIAQEVGPADVVLFEGILVFYFKEIRDMFNMKLFVDTDPDTRLSRRVLRDIQDRGRDLEQILHQYTSLVKPAFEEFCLPTKKYADVIIPRGADNVVAIDLIVQHIQEILHSQPVRRQRHHSDSFTGRPH